MNLAFLLFSTLYLWNGLSFWANRIEPSSTGNFSLQRGNFLKIGFEFDIFRNYSFSINIFTRKNIIIQSIGSLPDSLHDTVVVVDNKYIVPKPATDVLFIVGFSKKFFSDFRFFTGIGSFSYYGPPLSDINKYMGSYTQYIITAGLRYRKRISSTNLLLGLTFQYFYTFKRLKESYSLEGFVLFFDIGAIIKE